MIESGAEVSERKCTWWYRKWQSERASRDFLPGHRRTSEQQHSNISSSNTILSHPDIARC